MKITIECYYALCTTTVNTMNSLVTINLVLGRPFVGCLQNANLDAVIAKGLNRYQHQGFNIAENGDNADFDFMHV